MDTIGKIDFHRRLTRLLIDLNLVNVGGAKPFTGVLKFFPTFGVTDIEICDLKMSRLLFLMGRSGIVNIRFLIKGPLSVELDDPLLFI